MLVRTLRGGCVRFHGVGLYLRRTGTGAVRLTASADGVASAELQFSCSGASRR